MTGTGRHARVQRPAACAARLDRRHLLAGGGLALAGAVAAAHQAGAQAAGASHLVYVDSVAGSDANDGRLPTSAKRTIDAAVASIPRPGGQVVLLTPGIYDLWSSLTLDGVSVVGPSGPGGLHDAASSTSTTAWLRRRFDGHLIRFQGHGGGLRNLVLFDDSRGANRTGAAITYVPGTDGSGGALLPGWTYCENVRVTSTDEAGAWERIIEADGSALASQGGIRNAAFRGCYFFGARTPGEGLRLDTCVNWHFSGGGMFSAPTAISQGVKILSSGRVRGVPSSSISFDGFRGMDLDLDGQDISFVGGRANAVRIAPDAAQSVVVTSIAGSVQNGSSTCVVLAQRGPRNDAAVPSLVGLTARSPIFTIQTAAGPQNHAALGFQAGGSLGAAIGARNTSSGSFLVLGTSNNYAAGITNQALILDYQGRPILKAPPTPPTSSNLPKGALSFYLDETTAKLKVRARLSDGSYKTGELELS